MLSNLNRQRRENCFGHIALCKASCHLLILLFWSYSAFWRCQPPRYCLYKREIGHIGRFQDSSHLLKGGCGRIITVYAQLPTIKAIMRGGWKPEIRLWAHNRSMVADAANHLRICKESVLWQKQMFSHNTLSNLQRTTSTGCEKSPFLYGDVHTWYKSLLA